MTNAVDRTGSARAVVVGSHRSDGARAFGCAFDRLLVSTHADLLDDLVECAWQDGVGFLGIAADDDMFQTLRQALEWLDQGTVETVAVEIPRTAALREGLRRELAELLDSVGIQDFGGGPCLVLGARPSPRELLEGLLGDDATGAQMRARQDEEATAWELAAATGRANEFEREVAESASELKKARQKVRLLQGKLAAREAADKQAAAKAAEKSAPSRVAGPPARGTSPTGPFLPALRKVSGAFGARSTTARVITLSCLGALALAWLSLPAIIAGLVSHAAGVAAGIGASLLLASVTVVLLLVRRRAARPGARATPAQARAGSGA